MRDPTNTNIPNGEKPSDRHQYAVMNSRRSSGAITACAADLGQAPPNRLDADAVLAGDGPEAHAARLVGIADGGTGAGAFAGRPIALPLLVPFALALAIPDKPARG